MTYLYLEVGTIRLSVRVNNLTKDGRLTMAFLAAQFIPALSPNVIIGLILK